MAMETLSSPSAGAGAGFYVTGGTVPRDAACYVPRKADDDLLQGLRDGQFCYILTSRQMGKSSLMVRTAMRLRAEGLTCVVLDLTSIGQNLDAERWYGGLLNQLGQQVGLEDELDGFWLASSSLGPMQRWMQALQQVVLASRAGSLVIFVDEIDAVRSLPFSADEFFAAIRACYNRRSEFPEFGRLTFCLLGVATPSDLIRDVRSTPFNIGRRIELTDFTAREAAILGHGLDSNGGNTHEGERLIERVLYWTGGHPYLTQRLCATVAADIDAGTTIAPNAARPMNARVDSRCADLFLSSTARAHDDNLVFVRERLLRSEADVTSLLELYRLVLSGRTVPNDETNPLTSILLLSGIVRVTDGFLVIRNRIYRHNFNRAWALTCMPDADMQRQRIAYRRGMLGTATVAGVVVTAMAGLIAGLWVQTHSANSATSLARQLQGDIAAKRSQLASTKQAVIQMQKALNDVTQKAGIWKATARNAAGYAKLIAVENRQARITLAAKNRSIRDAEHRLADAEHRRADAVQSVNSKRIQLVLAQKQLALARNQLVRATMQRAGAIASAAASRTEAVNAHGETQRAVQEAAAARGKVVEAQLLADDLSLKKSQAEAAKLAAEQAKLAAEQKMAQAIGAAKHLTYGTDMELAQSDWDKHDFAHLSAMLDAHGGDPERGFEWYFWHRLFSSIE